MQGIIDDRIGTGKVLRNAVAPGEERLRVDRERGRPTFGRRHRRHAARCELFRARGQEVSPAPHVPAATAGHAPLAPAADRHSRLVQVGAPHAQASPERPVGIQLRGARSTQSPIGRAPATKESHWPATSHSVAAKPRPRVCGGLGPRSLFSPATRKDPRGSSRSTSGRTVAAMAGQTGPDNGQALRNTASPGRAMKAGARGWFFWHSVVCAEKQRVVSVRHVIV